MVLENIVSSKEGKGKFYWTVVVEFGDVHAGVWEVVGDEARILTTSPSVAWETDDELVGATDTALSSIVQSLDTDINEPSETVFGVTNSWVVEGEIKKEFLDKLKRICSELSLEPKGFVVLAESVAHFYKSEEGSPLSAVVIGVNRENIEITIFKLGNILGSTVVSRSVSVASDVMEGLVKFKANDNLPSRFLLYSGKEGELEEARQSLLEADWDNEKLKLLHTPKVELVDSKKKVLAVSLAGATEISNITRASLVKGKVDLADGVKAVEGKSGDKADKKGVVDEISDRGFPEHPDEGKVMGGDVVEPKEALDPRTFGFAIGKDVALEDTEPDRVKASSFEEGELKKKKLPIFGILGKAKRMLPTFRKKDREFKMHKLPKGKLYVVGAALLTFAIAGFIAWWYLPKARVTIYVAPKSFEEKISVFVDPSVSGSDLENNVIKGEWIETEVLSDKTKSTTGVKTVGDRAKGEVIIFRVGEEVTLQAGTTLVGPGSLEFNLDDEVTIASGSASSPSSLKTNVTAVAIGAEYNLAKDSDFVVGNYPTSEIEAKSEGDFSGGSSKEVNVVSKKDVEELEDDLTDELLTDAKQKLTDDISIEDFFIEESVSATQSSRVFSNNVDDEVSTLKLSLTLSVGGLFVKESDLFSLANELLGDKIPSGYVLREKGQVDTHFKFKEEKDGVYELEATFDVNLLPEINPDEVADKIAGKNPDPAKDYLKNIPGFVRAEIGITPKFPKGLQTLPRVSKRIEVGVAAER